MYDDFQAGVRHGRYTLIQRYTKRLIGMSGSISYTAVSECMDDFQARVGILWTGYGRASASLTWVCEMKRVFGASHSFHLRYCSTKPTLRCCLQRLALEPCPFGTQFIDFPFLSLIPSWPLTLHGTVDQRYTGSLKIQAPSLASFHPLRSHIDWCLYLVELLVAHLCTWLTLKGSWPR